MRSRIIAVLAVILVCAIGLYGFASYQAYNFLSSPEKHDLNAVPPVPYENVTFRSRGQNYKVYAFYIQGVRGAPALISVHGWKGSRHDSYDINRAVALRNLGYTVLALDLKDNGGDTVDNGRLSMGYKERWDVLGAFDYLLARGFPADQIGLVAESMGATTSLMAASVEPRIKAIWEDSGYTSAEMVAVEQAENYGFTPIIVPGGMVWGFVLSGDRLWEVTPITLGSTFAANKQSIYIVHDEPDEIVAFHHGVDFYKAFTAARVDVTFWDVPDGKHAQAINRHHAEYLRRLDAFFKAHVPWII